MKSFLATLVFILFLGSCITSNHVNYNDPNYLTSNEFSTYAEITQNQQEEKELFNTDTVEEENINYSADDYYDYSFSSRIRRFHRPLYYSGYYGGIYTDYYWYNNDPFSCGTSIYLGYNWHSPYYSYYTYSPYYFGYYTPYYYGNYYSYYALGHNQYHYGLYNSNYVNSNDHNAYITGHRTSLTSNGGGRGLNTNNNILSNTRKETSTLNIRNNNSIKDKVSNKRKYNLDATKKTNNTPKNRPEVKQQNNRSRNNTIKNSNRNNNRNNTIKNSNRNNNYKNQNKRSNSSNKSSRGGGKRNVKPRR